jgi:hypothetical protein
MSRYVARRSLKSSLAQAISRRESIEGWAKANGVKERTAYRWAKTLKLRSEVPEIRRRHVDRVIDRTSQSFTRAADQLLELGANAKSESVRLAALRTVVSNVTAFCRLTLLEQRLTELEQQLLDRTDHPDPPR